MRFSADRALLYLAAFCLFFSSQTAFAQSIWNNPVDGSWSDSSLWSLGVPNGAADDATISVSGMPYTVTGDVDIDLNLLTLDSSDATLLLIGRAWNINDRIQIDSGTLDLRGSTDISGDIVNSGGTINVTGSNSGFTANISFGSLINDGTLNMSSADSGWNSSITGTITNSGLFDIQAGSGGNRTYSGTMNNNGTVSVNRVFNVNGGNDWNQNSGSIIANELFSLNAGTMNIDGGSLTGRVAVRNGTINVLGTSTAAGVIYAEAATSLSGTINSGFEVTIQGSNNGSNANASSVAGFVNQGSLSLESRDSGWQSNFDATLGFTNGSSGTFSVRNGSGGSRNIFGTIINEGTIDGSDAAFRQTSGSLELAGGNLVGDVKVLSTAVSLTGSTNGELRLHGNQNTISGTINNSLSIVAIGSNDGSTGNSTSVGTLTNQGNFILDSINNAWNSTFTGDLLNSAVGKTQSLAGTGGGRTFNGTVTNFGELDFQANTTITGTGLNMESGSLASVGITKIDQATLNAQGGTLTGDVRVKDGDLNFLAGSTLSGQINTTGISTLSGTINSSASVAVMGANDGDNAILNSAGDVVNNGNLDLTSIQLGWNSTLNTTNLTNNGLLRSLAGTGGGRTISGQVDNFGQVEIDTRTAITGSGFAMKGGSLSGLGILEISGTKFTAEQGSITGQVVVNSGEIMFSPGSTLSGEIEARGNSILSGTINSAATVAIKGGNLGANAILATLSGAVNDGLITLDSVDNTWTATLDTTNGLTNNGTISVRPGAGGSRSIVGDLTNNGILDGSLSDFRFSGTLGMASGSTTGQVIASNTDANFAQSATGQIIFRGANNSIEGEIGENMTAWINGSNDGAASTMTIVSGAPLRNSGRILIESGDNTWQSNLIGQLTNESSGLVEINAGSGGTRSLQIALDNDGEFIFRTNATLGISGSTHENRGVMSIESGRVDLVGTAFENTGRLEGYGILDLNNTVTFTNMGIVGPGLSPGKLTIEGDYNQTSVGILEIELDGLVEEEFDLLEVLGDANLNGILQVDVNFAAMTGDTFRILTTTDTVNGTFSVEPSALDWDVVYGTNYVELVAVRNVPEPGTGLFCFFAGLAVVSRRSRQKQH